MSKFLFSTILVLMIGAGCGINTGNPGARSGDGMAGSQPPPPIAENLIGSVCKKIHECFPSTSTSICATKIRPLAGYTSELGSVASGYSTMNDLKSAEWSSTLDPSFNNYSTCNTAIQALSCSDPLIANNYSSSSPDDFSDTNKLFQASGSCQQIY